MRSYLSYASTVILLCTLHCLSNAMFHIHSVTSKQKKPIWNSTYTDKLKQDLLLNYDKFSRPSQHYNLTTVQFKLAITHVEVNELKSTITLHTMVKMGWNDDKLKWNTSDYNGIDVVHFGDHEIWQPDIFLYNSATPVTVNQYGSTYCLCTSTGYVSWVPPAQFSSVCHLDLKRWPYDTHSCNFVFGSWTHHGNLIDLELKEPTSKFEEDLLDANSEWKILSVVPRKTLKFYECCDEGYPDISYHIRIQRSSPMYKAIITAPTFAIVLLTLLTFWLPPQAGEKIFLNGCLAIIIVLYLLYFSQKLPALSSDTALIVYFYSSNLYIICFSMLNCIIAIWLSRTHHTKSLPWIMRQALVGFLGKWLGLGHYIGKPIGNNFKPQAQEIRDHQVTHFDDHICSEHHRVIRTDAKTPIQEDWILLAAALDRLAFIFYALVFAILSIAYLT